MKFNVFGSDEWFDGFIVSYNGMTGMYGVYFSIDKETIEVFLDDDDIKILD